MEEAKEKDGTDVINIKEKIEELVNNLDDIEMSGAAFFIGVNNRTGKIFIALSRVDIPAEKDKKESASIRMYDHEYLMTHEETEMLKYRDAEIYLGHENDDFVVRVKTPTGKTGGNKDV